MRDYLETELPNGQVIPSIFGEVGFMNSIQDVPKHQEDFTKHIGGVSYLINRRGTVGPFIKTR